MGKRPRAPLKLSLGVSLEENESAHLFGSICSGGMLHIGQAFAEASWGILALFLSPAASGAAERGRGALARDSSAVEDGHHSFLPPAAFVELGMALTAAVHRPATRLPSSNRTFQ